MVFVSRWSIRNRHGISFLGTILTHGNYYSPLEELCHSARACFKSGLHGKFLCRLSCCVGFPVIRNRIRFLSFWRKAKFTLSYLFLFYFAIIAHVFSLCLPHILCILNPSYPTKNINKSTYDFQRKLPLWHDHLLCIGWASLCIRMPTSDILIMIWCIAKTDTTALCHCSDCKKVFALASTYCVMSIAVARRGNTCIRLTAVPSGPEVLSAQMPLSRAILSSFKPVSIKLRLLGSMFFHWLRYITSYQNLL